MLVSKDLKKDYIQVHCCWFRVSLEFFKIKAFLKRLLQLGQERSESENFSPKFKFQRKFMTFKYKCTHKIMSLKNMVFLEAPYVSPYKCSSSNLLPPLKQSSPSSSNLLPSLKIKLWSFNVCTLMSPISVTLFRIFNRKFDPNCTLLMGMNKSIKR